MHDILRWILKLAVYELSALSLLQLTDNRDYKRYIELFLSFSMILMTASKMYSFFLTDVNVFNAGTLLQEFDKEVYDSEKAMISIEDHYKKEQAQKAAQDFGLKTDDIRLSQREGERTVSMLLKKKDEDTLENIIVNEVKTHEGKSYDLIKKDLRKEIAQIFKTKEDNIEIIIQ